ncbi:MAG: 2-C-methyl-D-erythritol 4-phosphate cytidylyltransferase [Nocardioides sp.]
MSDELDAEAPGTPGASTFPEGVTVWRLDRSRGWTAAAGRGRPVLVVDAATSPAQAARAAELAVAQSCVVVSSAPVVDTVKSVTDGLVTGTVERDQLAVVRPPVALPAEVAATVAAPAAEALGAWVSQVRARWPVTLLPAGPGSIRPDRRADRRRR